MCTESEVYLYKVANTILVRTRFSNLKVIQQLKGFETNPLFREFVNLDISNQSLELSSQKKEPLLQTTIFCQFEVNTQINNTLMNLFNEFSVFCIEMAVMNQFQLANPSSPVSTPLNLSYHLKFFNFAFCV